MLHTIESWSTQQLAEFLAVVSGLPDRTAAIRGGVERAAEALDAEVAALVDGGGVLASIGFPAGKLPERALRAAANGEDREVEFEGVGRCEVITAPLGPDDEGVLAVARSGGDEFTQEESDLLRGMGRVLALSLQSHHLVESLRERQALLERLSVLQRSIASRADLDEVFEAIVEGAHELLGDETVGLRLLLPNNPEEMEMVASKGVRKDLLPQMRRSRVGSGAGGRAISEGRLVVIEDYGDDPEMVPQMVDDGIRAALAAPVFQRGEVVGSLVVATHRAGRTYSASEREALLAFAEHAGLALNDAKAAEETAHQAFHDPLTGLPNRALFLDRLHQAQARSLRSGDSVGVLFVDLDGFKTVNDSLGHSAGDQLLISVGNRLEAILRPTDTVARFGGDEFALLLEEVEEPIDAARVARRALELLERPIEVAGREVLLTASIGIAVGRESPDDLLRNADIAMYEAKGRGKGRYELFQRDMHRAMSERLELEQDLKRATEANELELHFQPIVQLETGAVTGLEALVRWRHPERGLVPPLDFIPLAEEGGQIHEIGRWVMREAFREASGWRERHGPLEISINLSSVQLTQASLVRDVQLAIAEFELDPRRVTLEITETVLMDGTASNVQRLSALKDLGVRLAVDDFGTGYSSLQYLRRFPIDVLKVAKPFVDGVDRSGEEAGVARAIVELAHSLRLDVVAEGIETANQAASLVALGCPTGQGFYFSPPLPNEELDRLLAPKAPVVAP
jgi:diguanylate cyclase (GGDEF)-like protein